MQTTELVQEVLKKQGITPYRLAKEMKVSNSAVYRWIHGEKAANGQHTMELLRRAGRLAAMITFGAVITVISAPQEATAEVRSIAEFFTHYTQQ